MFVSLLKRKTMNPIVQLFVFVTILSVGNQAQGELLIKPMSFYGEGVQCITQTHWDEKCIEHATVGSGKARSLLDCAYDCLGDTKCTGVSSTSGTKSFFKHYTCSVESVDCNGGGTETKHSYFSKICDHGGKWQPEDESCACVDGWVGPTCQTYPKDCTDLSRAGYKNGKHAVLLDADGTGLNPISTVCFIYGNYHHIKMMASLGAKNSNKTWADYRDGFQGDPFWAGLNKWHLLSSRGFHSMTLKVTVKGVGSMARYYEQFKVTDESQKFVYTFQSSKDITDHKGDSLKALECEMGDCFGGYQNVPFSTWDHDQDSDVNENCASVFGMGWWFPQGCNTTCHLFGLQPSAWGSPGQSTRDRLSVVGMNDCMAHLMDKEFVIDVLIQKS